LQRTKFDQITIKRKRRPIPDVPVDSIAKQRHVVCVRAVYTRSTFSPVEINKSVLRKLRMQSNAEQPSFGSAIHWQVQHCALQTSVYNPLNLTGCFLSNEEVVWSNECQTRRLIEAGDYCANG